MTPDPADTIAAIASPPGPAHRGVLRLSGPESWGVALAGFTADSGQVVPGNGRPRPGRVTGAYRVDGLRPPLPASIVFWAGPRSYTGQDAAEVHTLGAPPLLGLLLSQMLSRGAREAGPGEFTLRAFLSGRIDLTRAEAVLGVIEARTPAQLSAALEQLGGGLASPLTALRDRLLDVLAHVEANLDFMDEPDVDELARSELAQGLARGAADLAALAGRLKGRDRLEGRPRVVLVGPPNAGKSRLFNALLGADRALVSPLAGTTRDYITAPCDCDGLAVDLIDTAGLDDARAPVEARAQAFRMSQTALADLLLLCTPADAGSPLSAAGDRPSLSVRTKSDLAADQGSTGAISTSAATGEGLDPLRRAIAAALRSQTAEDDPATTTAARCRESLVRASEALQSASQAVTLGAGDELVAVDLRQAIDDLGRVVGAVVTDDILDRIFRRFCIGK